ncbi:MAG: helix-turn-helix domain-containing protein [Promethearchaeota archaeon]
MSNYEIWAVLLLRSQRKIKSVAIIENTKEIVYSTENWDLSEDIENIISSWGLNDSKFITVSEVKYSILENTSEILVASSIEKKGHIIGFKEDERKILTYVEPGGNIKAAVVEISRILRAISSKEPYMDLEASLGKVDDLKWTSPKIWYEEKAERLLQEFSLQKFGLSFDEAKIYLALWEKGKKGATVGLLYRELDIKRTSIYSILGRLIEKKWVEILSGSSPLEMSKAPKGARRYIAKPPDDLLNKIIYAKEKELEELKNLRLLFTDVIRREKKLTSEIIEDSSLLSRKVSNYEVLGKNGIYKNYGFIIIEYNRNIKDDIKRDDIELAFKLVRRIIEYEIKNQEIPDLDQIEIFDTMIHNYSGAVIYLKFKDGSRTAKIVGNRLIIAGKLVAIPVDNKIFMIWGEEEKVQVLMKIVLDLA